MSNVGATHQTAQNTAQPGNRRKSGTDASHAASSPSDRLRSCYDLAVAEWADLRARFAGEGGRDGMD
jgi:hypothetical protein